MSILEKLLPKKQNEQLEEQSISSKDETLGQTVIRKDPNEKAYKARENTYKSQVQLREDLGNRFMEKAKKTSTVDDPHAMEVDPPQNAEEKELAEK